MKWDWSLFASLQEFNPRFREETENKLLTIVKNGLALL